MNIGLVVNARGKMCLVHDESFPAIPSWVAYHTDTLRLEIMFDTGDSYPIDWRATHEMDQYLRKLNKILLIRMEDKKPVEGYDTSLVGVCNMRIIPGPVKLRDGSELRVTSDGTLCLTIVGLPCDRPPDGIEYDALGRLLSLTWRDGRHQPISYLPVSEDAVPDDIRDKERGLELFHERKRLWKQIVALGTIPDVRKKDMYLRIKQINQEIGEPKSNSDDQDPDDLHDEIIAQPHMRVIWSPEDTSSGVRESSGFNLVVPISLALEGNIDNRGASDCRSVR
jgi:hypothetical protein